MFLNMKILKKKHIHWREWPMAVFNFGKVFLQKLRSSVFSLVKKQKTNVIVFFSLPVLQKVHPGRSFY